MTLFCCLNEGIVYYVGLIPSRYYKVLVDKEKSAFFQLLGTSLFTVFLAGFVSRLMWGKRTNAARGEGSWQPALNHIALGSLTQTLPRTDLLHTMTVQLTITIFPKKSRKLGQKRHLLAWQSVGHGGTQNADALLSPHLHPTKALLSDHHDA